MMKGNGTKKSNRAKGPTAIAKSKSVEPTPDQKEKNKEAGKKTSLKKKGMK